MAPRLKSVVALLVAGALAMSLAGCSGHKKAKSDPTPSGSGTPTAASGSVQDLQNKVLGTSTTATAIATSSASVHLIGSSSTTAGLTAEVVSVTVSGSTTLLHWRLKSSDGSSVSASGNWASGGTTTATDTRNVALLDTAAKVRLLPYLNAGQAIFGDTDCVCSDTPRTVSATAVDMYATYPALAASSTTVTVSIPGFPAMANVTVTR
jgi:hypothetical protein